MVSLGSNVRSYVILCYPTKLTFSLCLLIDYPNVTVNGGEVAYAKESSNVKLSCQSSSPNASRYKWYFEQELIVDGAEYTVSKPTGNELCIKNFSASQIGEYVCVAAEDSVHVPRNGSTSVQFTRECTRGKTTAGVGAASYMSVIEWQYLCSFTVLCTTSQGQEFALVKLCIFFMTISFLYNLRAYPSGFRAS